MKVGDLVRFKVHRYDKLYGMGIIFGVGLQTQVRVFFAGECLMVNTAEMRVISESR